MIDDFTKTDMLEIIESFLLGRDKEVLTVVRLTPNTWAHRGGVERLVGPAGRIWRHGWCRFIVAGERIGDVPPANVVRPESLDGRFVVEYALVRG